MKKYKSIEKKLKFLLDFYDKFECQIVEAVCVSFVILLFKNLCGWSDFNKKRN